MHRLYSGYIRSNRGNSAFTIVELLITVVVASLTVSSISVCYLAVRKGVILQSDRAEKVITGSVAKARLENLFDSVYKTLSVNDDRIKYKQEFSDTVHIITYRDSVLCRDGREIIDDLKSVKWDMNSDRVNNRSLLYWETETVKGQWLAGAVIVVIERD